MSENNSQAATNFKADGLENPAYKSEHDHSAATEKPDIFRLVKAGLLIPIQDIVEHEGIKCLEEVDADGHTPIHWAALGGHTHVLRYFIQKGAPLNIPSKNQLGAQPIHWASVNGHVAVVDIVLQSGVSINAVDNKGCTPLIMAAQYGHTMLAGFLMGKGARMQVTDKEGDNALHWAGFKGHCELTRFLINSGFNPLQKDGFGQTALHLACLSGDLMTVKLLCEQDGADINLADLNGNTPLKLSKGRNYKDIHRYLEGRQNKTKRFINSINLQTVVFGPPGNSRYAFLFMMFMMMAYGYPCYLFKVLPYTLYDLQTLHVLFFVNTAFTLYCLFKTHTLDPGFLMKNLNSYDQALKQVAYFDEWKQGENPLSRLCHTCKLVKPYRTKHCRITNRCVQHFDHFCPYVYNVVGYRNRHYFLAFLFGMMFTTLTGVFSAYYMTKHFEYDVILLLGGGFMFLFSLLSVGLFSVTLYQAFVNLTTNERINSHRYTYLKDGNGQFINPFDQGWKMNLQEYFHLKAPLELEASELAAVKVV